jgi:hypothetical protein
MEHLMLTRRLKSLFCLLLFTSICNTETIEHRVYNKIFNKFNYSIVQKVDPKLKSFFEQELHSVYNDIQNVTFLNNGEDDFHASARTNSKEIILSNFLVLLASNQDSLWQHGISFRNKSSDINIEIEIPQALAQRIALAIVAHELTHMQKNHHKKDGKSNHPNEWEADNGVLPKHVRSAFVLFQIHNVMLCYGAKITKKIESELLDQGDNISEIEARNYLLKHKSHQLYLSVVKEPSHPTHFERAEKFKERALKEDPINETPHEKSSECATITISNSENPTEMFKKFLVCESFLDVKEIS